MQLMKILMTEACSTTFRITTEYRDFLQANVFYKSIDNLSKRHNLQIKRKKN